jgi:hypothetical protein
VQFYGLPFLGLPFLWLSSLPALSGAHSQFLGCVSAVFGSVVSAIAPARVSCLAPGLGLWALGFDFWAWILGLGFLTLDF